MSFPMFQSIDEFVVRIKEQEENQRENYIRRHSDHYNAQRHPNATFQVDLCDILLDDNYRHLWSNQNQNNETVSTETTTTNEDLTVQDTNVENIRENDRENEELTRANEDLIQENENLTYEFEELTYEYEDLIQENQELSRELRVLQQRNTILEMNERHRRETLNRRTCFFNRPTLGIKCIKKIESKTNEECPICLDNNILTKNMLWFDCNHGVCSVCITEFLKPKPSHHKCPLCREKIDNLYLKYNRSEGTRSEFWQSENVTELLKTVCK